MRIISFCPSVGVPLGTPNVAVAARAVSAYISSVSALGVGVLLDAVELSRGVIRLLVNVCVSVVPTIVPVGAVTALKTPLVNLAIPVADARLNVLPPVPENM